MWLEMAKVLFELEMKLDTVKHGVTELFRCLKMVG